MLIDKAAVLFDINFRDIAMASSKAYLNYILDQLSYLEGISFRPMMGEYIIYYRDKIVGGIYDDRLLLKPTHNAISYMKNVIYEIPYKGAKEMLYVENVDSKECLTTLFEKIYEELPSSANKKK